MKLVTFRASHHAQPSVGVVVSNEHIVDLARHGAGKRPASMVDLLESGEVGLASARQAIDDFQAGRVKTGVYAASTIELLAPVPRPGKIVHTACNFTTHLAELTTWRAPEWQAHNWNKFHYEHPTGFLEAPSSVVGPSAKVHIPVFTGQLDYEIEIGIVIGKEANNVAVEDALDHVAGYTIFNDLSARDIQAREHANKVILMGKSFVGSCPFGPYLVTRDEFPDDLDLSMELTLNGEVRQLASTAQMRYSPRALVSWWSLMSLQPGDIITSGSPPGVIAGSPNPVWLRAGDRIDARVSQLGTLTTFIAEKRQ
jgi:2-keto-4-pentenoate hydratase/2-oxohepta-3-ene-1,7-dioic acid hydratase in catechol pathway